MNKNGSSFLSINMVNADNRINSLLLLDLSLNGQRIFSFLLCTAN